MLWSLARQAYKCYDDDDDDYNYVNDDDNDDGLCSGQCIVCITQSQACNYDDDGFMNLLRSQFVLIIC